MPFSVVFKPKDLLYTVYMLIEVCTIFFIANSREVQFSDLLPCIINGNVILIFL
jgi:hypothetical protein